jgi:hypothetical protein
MFDQISVLEGLFLVINKIELPDCSPPPQDYGLEASDLLAAKMARINREMGHW